MRRFVPLHGSDPATYVAPSSSRSPTYPIDNRHILSIRCGDFQRWGAPPCIPPPRAGRRSEEHTSELQSLMRISYAVFCLKKQKKPHTPPILQYIAYHHPTHMKIQLQ